LLPPKGYRRAGRWADTTAQTHVLSSFRADVARAGAARNVQSLVDELCATSPEFAAMWRDNDVQGHGDGRKVLQHPVAGPLSMEFSTFAIDGRPDLNMAIFNPATPEDADKIRALLKSPPRRAREAAAR
jgi:hypothetical protein